MTPTALRTEEPEVMTAAMMGWRAGLGIVRKTPESARRELIAIVTRLVETESQLAAWITRVAPTLLDAGELPDAWRLMVDGLRRGLLDGAAEEATGVTEQLHALPWWTRRADFDAEQVRICRAYEALRAQEDFATDDADPEG